MIIYKKKPNYANVLWKSQKSSQYNPNIYIEVKNIVLLIHLQIMSALLDSAK